MMKTTMSAGPRVAACVLGLGALVSGGCVSQQAYDDLLTENRTLTSRNVDLQSRVGELEQMTRGLQQNTTDSRGAMSDLDRANAMLRQQLNQSRATILDLEDRLDSIQLREIDPTTDLALTRLAARYPDLLAYDSQRGMIRLASDLTFDSGSAEVKAEAKQSLSALGEVLGSPEASGYDIRIVGHTDSATPSARTKQRHPTNMHLSAHRAIAVRQELLAMGLRPSRMYAAGWGEFRPVVPNNPDGNTRENRRVEIYLLPATAGRISEAPEETGTPANVDRQRLNAPATDPTK